MTSAVCLSGSALYLLSVGDAIVIDNICLASQAKMSQSKILIVYSVLRIHPQCHALFTYVHSLSSVNQNGEQGISGDLAASRCSLHTLSCVTVEDSQRISRGCQAIAYRSPIQQQRQQRLGPQELPYFTDIVVHVRRWCTPIRRASSNNHLRTKSPQTTFRFLPSLS